MICPQSYNNWIANFINLTQALPGNFFHICNIEISENCCLIYIYYIITLFNKELNEI